MEDLNHAQPAVEPVRTALEVFHTCFSWKIHEKHEENHEKSSILEPKQAFSGPSKASAPVESTAKDILRLLLDFK